MRPHKAQSIAHLGCYEPIPSPDLPAGSTRGGFVTTPGDPEVSSILTYAVQYLPMPETKECIITVVLRVSPRSSFAYLLVWHERPATAFVFGAKSCRMRASQPRRSCLATNDISAARAVGSGAADRSGGRGAPPNPLLDSHRRSSEHNEQHGAWRRLRRRRRADGQRRRRGNDGARRTGGTGLQPPGGG